MNQKKLIIFEPLTLDKIRKYYINFDGNYKVYYHPIHYYYSVNGENPNFNQKLKKKDPKEVFDHIFIPNGNAKWSKINNDFDDLVQYNLTDWLISNTKQKDGEEILLDGIQKNPISLAKGIKKSVEPGFENTLLEICNGNYISPNCNNSKCWIQKLNDDEYPVNNSKKILESRELYINDKYNTYKTYITYKNEYSNNFHRKNLISEDQRVGYAKINYYKGGV